MIDTWHFGTNLVGQRTTCHYNMQAEQLVYHGLSSTYYMAWVLIGEREQKEEGRVICTQKAIRGSLGMRRMCSHHHMGWP